MRLSLAVVFIALVSHTVAARAAEASWKAAAASIDITPQYPIRLSGYAARKTESEGAEQPIHAKAIALHDGTGPAVLMTVDSIGVPAHVTEEVARRLNEKHRLSRERFALCSSHSHCTPMLADSIPNLFGAPLPADQQATIARYTADLIDRLEKVATEALGNCSRLNWPGGRGARRSPPTAGRRRGRWTTPCRCCASRTPAGS